MAITTNAFENYKNEVAASSNGGFLSKLKGFGVDSLGGLDSFMGKDIINANKLMKSFTGFNLGNMFKNLGNFFGDLLQSALQMLTDMGMDALHALENASINFVSNLAEDLWNNVRSVMYIPDSAFAITLKGMYYAGADLAYNDHYIRRSALQRDWKQSLEFIDEQYGIDYNLRDYKDLELDLSTCANGSCVNNMYYIFEKMYSQITELKEGLASDETKMKPFTEPIIDYKLLTYDEALTCDDLYVKVMGEMVSLDMTTDEVSKEPTSIDYIKEHPTFEYYTKTITDYVGISHGLFDEYEYETDAEKEDIESTYNSYIDTTTLIQNSEQMMVRYFKMLIVHSYTYLTATSVQKFFTQFSNVLKPKYYGITDDKYYGKFQFTISECMTMLPDYTSNDVTKSDMYTQQLAAAKNAEYLAKRQVQMSEQAKAANEKNPNRFNNSTHTKSTTKKKWNAWDTNDGDTVEGVVQKGLQNASEKVHNFRDNARRNVAASQNASYSSAIQNGLTGGLGKRNTDILNRSRENLNAKQDNKKISTMYDREVVKFYEMLGQGKQQSDQKVVLRNKNIKQIYTLMANETVWGDDRMINDPFYQRCKLKTMNLLNQSLSKVAGILGSTYLVQAAFDLEAALDSSAYVYVKKVEDYLLNPKEHSYHGIDTMFSGGDNMWTQFGDYFKQAYTFNDSVGTDPGLESLVDALTSSTPSAQSSTTTGTSDIDPDEDLSEANSANSKTYKEVMEELDENQVATTFVDNVVRFMSTISSLDLRDLLTNSLTAFYNYIKARDINTSPYFKNLINSMAGSEIDSPSSLNSEIFNKSTRKSLLANAKFLISIYALKNSYKYFLTDMSDSNKEELVKLYDLVFANAAANIQMLGVVSAISKFDREQLNTLVKQNFFTSIEHLKSINSRSNSLLKTAPGYKDTLTKTFGNQFDLRGITGYSFDNDKVLYITEHSTGDWNSVVSSIDKDVGSFFCKSNINGFGRGVYRRLTGSSSLTKMTVKTTAGSEFTDRDLYGISFSDTGEIYFGIDDISSSKPATTNTLFVFNSTSGNIEGVSGFEENPKDFDFVIDTDLNLLILTSKVTGGCYYTKLGSTTCTKGTSNGGKHKFVKLGNGTKVLYPTQGTSELLYFDVSGNLVNKVSMPSGVTTITSVNPVISNIIVNIQQTPPAVEGSTEPPQPVTVPTPMVVYGLLVGTNSGLVHCLAIASIDSTTGVQSDTSQLELGKTYKFSDDNLPCYIYEDTVIGFENKSAVIYKKYVEDTVPTITPGASLTSYDLFKFETGINIGNTSLQSISVILNSTYTDDGVYVLLQRPDISTNDLYFAPRKYTGDVPQMYLIRDSISPGKSTFNVITTTASSTSIPNIITYNDNSIDFVSIRRDSDNVTATIKPSKFRDIDSDNASNDSKVVKESKTGWKDISIPGDSVLYIQNTKYGIIMFGSDVHEINKYSDYTYVGSSNINHDIVFDFQILKAKGKTFFANKSSGPKYINNVYGIFKSSNGGITRNYADTSAFHDGDISSMAYDKFDNCLYFCTLRDKTIFNYDYLATTAAFDIDAYISKLSYYELSKLVKNLLTAQNDATTGAMVEILSEKDSDGNFVYDLDELLESVVNAALKIQESSQKSLMSSTLFADLANYKAASEEFDDVESDVYNDDMTKSFVASYPGDITTASPNPLSTKNFKTNLVGDINGDGIVDELDDINGDGIIDDEDKNWYLAMLKGQDTNNFVSLDDWFNNLANGVYGNGLGSLTSLRLSYNQQIKLLAKYRSSRTKYITSGHYISEENKDDSILEGPGSVIDSVTDPSSKDYKWYHSVDFATNDFLNSDENGESSWQ